MTVDAPVTPVTTAQQGDVVPALHINIKIGVPEVGHEVLIELGRALPHSQLRSLLIGALQQLDAMIERATLHKPLVERADPAVLASLPKIER